MIRVRYRTAPGSSHVALERWKLLPLIIALLALLPDPTTARSPCVTDGDIPCSQCHALVEIYRSTGGPKWANNQGWLTNDTPCNWFGVTCANGSVIRIELPRNNLTGTIASLHGLPDLERLALQRNSLAGTIPDLLHSPDCVA